MLDVNKYQKKLEEFAKDREWERYHSPKNLSIAMSVEVGELLEIFQWMNEEDSRNLKEEDMELIKEEMADVLLYYLRLSDVMGMNIEEILDAK